jgi:hypothetical protein
MGSQAPGIWRMTLNLEAGATKYWAFISYSHADSRWAQWLHRSLETYPIPARLHGRHGPDGPIPRRLRPVFRDQDELPSAPDLTRKIRDALAQSRYLIVLCSPHAAVSRWVDKEIDAFKELGRGDRVLCVIVDGHPNARANSGQHECFPPALRSADVTHQGASGEAVEPLAADARPGRGSRQNALLKLIAGILGLSFEDLRRREHRRRLCQRMRAVFFATLGTAGIALAYVGATDDGLALPGGRAVQRLLDHYHASVFRPVHDMSDIVTAAARARAALIARLDGEWISHAWLKNNVTRLKGPKLAISPWISSQAAYAALLTIPASDARMRDFYDALESLFAKGVLIENDGKKFGWMVSDGDFTQAEATLWTLAALALAARRDELWTGDQRRNLLTRLDETEEIADLYRPGDDGGWNMFAQQQAPSDHSTYSTALAFLALLELRRGSSGWHGDAAQLDDRLRATESWLERQFDNAGGTRGWRVGPGDPGPIMDGLTLQIYDEMLRAEGEANIAVTTAILAAIPATVELLFGRPSDFPIASGAVSRVFTNFDGSPLTRWDQVRFLWYPWAIDLTMRWLQRLERTGGSPEAKVRAQRALGYLVVDLGSRLLPEAEGKAETFVASETLLGLAVIPPESSPPTAEEVAR